MKKFFCNFFAIVLILNLFILPGFGEKELKKKKLDGNKLDLRNGDLFFQSLGGNQGTALKLALQSKINHVGMVYISDGEIFVIEAWKKVTLTPINKYIKRNKGHFEVKRLKDADKKITKSVWKKMSKLCDEYVDKDYDLYFSWDDERFYCSELVWKIYDKCVGIKLGKLKKLKEFDLTHPLVKKLLKERYGDNPPLEDKVISPDTMYESKELETVLEN